MKLKHILLASLLFAVSWVFAQQSGGGTFDHASGQSSGSISSSFTVPSGSTQARFSVYDSDPLFNDLLFESNWQDIPEGTKNWLCTFHFWCVDGEVCGPSGSSGEGSAELFIVVEFNYGGGKSESQVFQVKCP